MDDAGYLLHEKYRGVENDAYAYDLARLKAGEPLAYVIGWVPFLGTKIFLDSRPLIPRAETEFWAEKAIEAIRKAVGGRPLRLLDLFAGSGAIGVAALKHLPEAHADFGEIDPRHFPTIELNLEENAIVPTRARLIETDVWQALDRPYDFIFANPPYLSEKRAGRVEQSVIAHEPLVSLFAGEDGFALIRRTLEGLTHHLAPYGALFIEHEPEHVKRLSEASKKLGFESKAHEDQYGTLRYSVVRRPD